MKTKIYADYFQEHAEVLAATETACSAPLNHLAQHCVDALTSGGKILFFGNGGSAADAQHFATELTVRFIANRRALAAIALTVDSSAITACGNDLGFETVFSRQLEALGRRGDVAIAFSTSGNSPNIIAALRAAREIGITPAAFSGRTGGQLRDLADPMILIPSNTTARIQEMHELLGHILCAEIESRLGV